MNVSGFLADVEATWLDLPNSILNGDDPQSIGPITQCDPI